MADTKPKQRAEPAPTEPTGDSGVDELQARFDQIHEQGFEGTTPDETPNEAYALPDAGVGTPEADRIHPDKQ